MTRDEFIHHTRMKWTKGIADGDVEWTPSYSYAFKAGEEWARMECADKIDDLEMTIEIMKMSLERVVDEVNCHCTLGFLCARCEAYDALEENDELEEDEEDE